MGARWGIRRWRSRENGRRGEESKKPPAGIRWVFGRLSWERGCQNPTLMSLLVLSRFYRIVIYTISLYKQLEITYYISSRYSRFLRFTPSQLLFYRMDHNQQQNDAGLLNCIAPPPPPPTRSIRNISAIHVYCIFWPFLDLPQDHEKTNCLCYYHQLGLKIYQQVYCISCGRDRTYRLVSWTPNPGEGVLLEKIGWSVRYAS